MLEGFITGAVTATLCITVGHILHMRFLDRRLLPPAKPAHKPTMPTGGTPTP